VHSVPPEARRRVTPTHDNPELTSEQLLSNPALNVRLEKMAAHKTARRVGPKAVGPLTGSVPPSARQAMVDEFTARARPSVLVSQIQAGGVGLNIQAASVVIIAEPQWTPAIEEQAIARCHRMGQVRRVDVHRLLTEDSVDQRMLEILRVKADEFDEYARRSDLKDITPDAVDISDLTAAAQVASQAENERRIVEMERKRLRMEEAEGESR
jgi:superfamily II DNA or RNA helicase